MQKKKRNPYLHTNAKESLQRQYSTFPFFPSQTYSHMHTQRHIPPTPTPHCFPSASKMWVNEAPPGGTVSNTSTTRLRGRGGERVGGGGGGLRDTEHGQHQRWKCGRVQLIRQSDCGMCMNYMSVGRWIELYSRDGLLQQLRARLCRNVKLVILSCRVKNKMDLLLL